MVTIVNVVPIPTPRRWDRVVREMEASQARTATIVAANAATRAGGRVVIR